MQIVAHYGNARQIHDRFSLTRLIAGYRIRADERSWRRAAYGSPSNWPGEWVVAGVLLVAIVLTGLVQTRQHWGTMQSESDSAKQAAAREKTQDNDLGQRLASLNSALEDANAQLAVSYTKVGDVLMTQGNLAEALKSYRDGLVVADRVAKANPGNADWQRDLAISQGRVGVLLAKQGDVAHALDMLQQGRAVVARLVQQLPTNAQLSKDLAAFDDNIAKLKQAGISETGSIKPKQAAP